MHVAGYPSCICCCATNLTIGYMTNMPSSSSGNVLEMAVAPYERASFEHELAQTLAHDMAVFLDLSSNAQLRCYALVNVGQCGEITEHRQQDSQIAYLVRRHGLNIEELFRHTPEAALAGIGPWLIELPPSLLQCPETSAALYDLALHAGTVQALSLLASPLRAAHLAAHLRSWLHGLILPDPMIANDEAMGGVIRWFDPRTGFDIVSCWSEADQRNFLRAFTWAGWNAKFEPQGRRGSPSPVYESAERTEPLPLDKDLLLALAPLNHADDLLADVLEQAETKTFAFIAPALQRWVAIAQVVAAQELGIADRESRLTLLHHALSLHPDLSRLPGLQERLAKEAASGRVLAHVLDARSASWWQEQRDAAPAVWAQWAHQFLAPAIARLTEGVAKHPFMGLLASSTPYLR